MRISDWSSDVCSSDLRIGAALALNAARAPIDLGGAAARPGDVAGAAEGSADRARRIAKRAAQRSAEASAQAAPKPAAAAEQLRRGRGRKCQGRRGERESRRKNMMCHHSSPSSFGPEGRAWRKNDGAFEFLPKNRPDGSAAAAIPADQTVAIDFVAALLSQVARFEDQRRNREIGRAHV